MKRILLVALCLLLAACATASRSTFTPVQMTPEPNEPGRFAVTFIGELIPEGEYLSYRVYEMVDYQTRRQCLLITNIWSERAAAALDCWPLEE